MAKQNDFLEKRLLVVQNLEELQLRVDVCVEQGMVDDDDQLYNQVLTLIDDADEVTSPDELSEIVVHGKVIEENLDVWLSQHGFSTLGLSWPQL